MKFMPIRSILLAAVLCAAAAHAEPYIAVRTGFKCSQCHVNKSGGGMRTDYGSVYSQYKLLMKSALAEKLPASFDPKFNASISAGANFRIEQKYMPQVSSRPVNAGDSQYAVASSWDAGAFRESNIYLNVELVKNWLQLYSDVNATNGASRELWAMVRLPANSYAKAGNMLLPYGYRLMDDAAFVRNATGYTYGTTGMAYEMGIEPGPLSLIVNFTQESMTSVGSLLYNGNRFIRSVRAGGSVSRQLKKREKDKDGSYGVFGGFAMGMFTVLGERDWIKDDYVDRIADYAEVGFLPVQGLNFRFVYESLWPDRKVAQASSNKRRITLGAEPFLTQFLQLGLYYRLNEWIPQNAEANQDEVVGRIHVFF